MAAVVTLREIVPDGMTYAYGVWRLSDGSTLPVYITQAEYDDFTRGGTVEPAGRPTPDAVFLMAAGGLPNFTTGRPQVGDFWITNETTRDVIVYLDNDPQWSYGQTTATEPLNGQSRETGNEYGVKNNSIALTLTKTLLTRLRAGTLTRTVGQISIVNNVVTIPSGYVQRLDRTIDRFISNHRSVTFDASSHGSAFASSFTIAHTVAVQSNRAMIAGMGIRQGDIVDIVYNGSTLTPITSNYWVSGNDARASTAQMIAPSTGTNNIVFTTGSALVIGGAAISAYGVDQTTPISNSSTNGNGSSAAPTVTITSAVDELAFTIDVWHINNTGATCTNDATWTSITQENPFGYLGVEGAYITGASSVTRTDALSAAAQWAMIGSSLKAASGGGGGNDIAWLTA